MAVLFRIWQADRRQKGMAVIMVLSALLFTVLIIQQTVFETQVEHASSAKELHDLQAYYAAKAGLEIGLLRLRTYNKLVRLQKGMGGGALDAYMSMIWRLPFEWPPPLLKLKSKPFMKAKYTTHIMPTAGRLDLNDLHSPSPELTVWTWDQLFNLFKATGEEAYLKNNEKSLGSRRIDPVPEAEIRQIINNIRDWIDEDNQQFDISLTRRGGGSSPGLPETARYSAEQLPPANRFFVNKEELRLVSGITDEIYNRLSPYITVYGEKGLNINHMDSLLLRSLGMDDETAQTIVQDTSKLINPLVFSKNSFFTFLSKMGMRDWVDYQTKPGGLFEMADRFEKTETASFRKKIKGKPKLARADFLLFNPPHNFKIVSTGQAGRSRKTITAVYMDLPSQQKRLKKLVLRSYKFRGRARGHGNDFRNETADKRLPSEPAGGGQPLAPMIIYWKVSP